MNERISNIKLAGEVEKHHPESFSYQRPARSRKDVTVKARSGAGKISYFIANF